MEDQLTNPVSNQLDNFFNLAFDASTRAQLKQAALWAKICTLCAFIGYAVALVVAIFGRADEASLSGEGINVTLSSSGNNVFGAVITAAIGVFINYFLYRFATATARGMDSMDTIRTNEGFNSLRIYFKIYGIILIVCLSIAALVMLVGIIGMGLRG
ncbi:MAG TPA: hypothetical protein VG605_02920 [Puia sp.]|jgi:hypothetical protein|nr:hypothetical protein [Puia sp.]